MFLLKKVVNSSCLFLAIDSNLVDLNIWLLMILLETFKLTFKLLKKVTWLKSPTCLLDSRLLSDIQPHSFNLGLLVGKNTSYTFSTCITFRTNSIFFHTITSHRHPLYSFCLSNFVIFCRICLKIVVFEQKKKTFLKSNMFL